MQGYAAQRRVRDGGAAKCEVEVCQIGESKRQNFGRGIGEGTAEGLAGISFKPGDYQCGGVLTRSSSLSPLAALVRYTIALSVR